jgi:hypothetical protein
VQRRRMGLSFGVWHTLHIEETRESFSSADSVR